jgi:hypothetical protein
MGDSEELKDIVLKRIGEIRNIVDQKLAAKLSLNLLERFTVRAASFSNDCEECRDYLQEIDKWVSKIADTSGQLEKPEWKDYQIILKRITDHMQKVHKLVPENYYMEIYMSMGISLGMVFGLSIMHNIGIGMCFGLAIGVALGSGMDSDAKKKGLTI